MGSSCLRHAIVIRGARVASNSRSRIAIMAEEKIAEKGLPVDECYPAQGGYRCHCPNREEYEEMYAASVGPNRGRFWRDQAMKTLRWMQPCRQVVQENFKAGDTRWFIEGTLNACDNCVDRWAEEAPDRTAIIYEGDEPTITAKVSYQELLQETCRVANLYKFYGAKKGDCITVYMPNIPEAAYAMLAAARIGLIHSVVFAGFSKEALKERLRDAASPYVVTADECLRGRMVIRLKQTCDAAMAECSFIKTCFVFRRTGGACSMREGRDVWADDGMAVMRPYCVCEPMDSEDYLFMLYTSGSTGKPKAVAHSTAGYLLWTALTTKYVFDVHIGDCYACVADIGWITGHSYIIYGPLTNGASTFMFESVPTYPDAGRYWDMVQRHKITQFYTAPTAIRILMKTGEAIVKKYDRSSLRILGSVGEPINPEAWRWYYDVVGDKRCPIMDTFWQTETGGIMLTPLPSLMLKPGSCALPFFGVEPKVLHPVTGTEIEGNNVAGVLAFARSWPAMLRTLYGDHQKMLDVYMRPFPGYYVTGDGCVRDKDGYYWITGRIDDVISVAGHHIGSAEVEHALMSHSSVAESAVVGYPHETKGTGLFCYVTLKDGVTAEASLRGELKATVRKIMGPFAIPDIILFARALPTTRSGKIMRRILRKIAERDTENLGDISSMLDICVVEELIRKADKLFF
mmetsp:Transcript_145053/g.267433  ORF Transcript_145053/g.267433 Transcript_145053/m.267433 type:complete len:686 (+) Transcript_145053:1-2058(+)